MGSCGFFPFFMNLFYSTHSLFLRVIMFVLDFDVMDGAGKGIILNIRKCRAVIIPVFHNRWNKEHAAANSYWTRDI